MATIQITTKINAPIQTVFDFSRNIDIHQLSAKETSESAIAGVTSGLIGLNETVTWKGKHFGIFLKHKTRITAFENPQYFVDEMEKGHFKSFRHEHFFEFENEKTIMTDKLSYETPYGIFGKLFDYFLLKKHLTKFLTERNQWLQSLSESQE